MDLGSRGWRALLTWSRMSSLSLLVIFCLYNSEIISCFLPSAMEGGWLWQGISMLTQSGHTTPCFSYQSLLSPWTDSQMRTWQILICNSPWQGQCFYRVLGCLLQHFLLSTPLWDLSVQKRFCSWFFWDDCQGLSIERSVTNIGTQYFPKEIQERE